MNPNSKVNIFQRLVANSWLWQTTGIIDHEQRINSEGTQPVRFLFQVTLQLFRTANNSFWQQLNDLIIDKKIANKIDLQFGKEPIFIGNNQYRTPKILLKDRTLQLHETFLSYQWCISYALYVFYVETIDYPKINAFYGSEVKKITPKKLEEALELFSYGKFIIMYFEEWDKDALPNPERYPAENRDYVEQTNLFFSYSIVFILCHEVKHAESHLDQLPDESCYECFHEMEYEADDAAIDVILQDAPADKIFLLEIGIVLGILSMLFFRSTTTGIKHPNVEDRLTNALERMKADSESVAWAFACVGIKLWDEQFNHGFDWNAMGKITFKELYYDVISQMKKRQDTHP